MLVVHNLWSVQLEPFILPVIQGNILFDILWNSAIVCSVLFNFIIIRDLCSMCD